MQEDIGETYNSVNNKFSTYKHNIEKYQKEILLGVKSIEEIQKDFQEMQEKHLSWCDKSKETFEFK